MLPPSGKIPETPTLEGFPVMVTDRSALLTTVMTAVVVAAEGVGLVSLAETIAVLLIWPTPVAVDTIDN